MAPSRPMTATRQIWATSPKRRRAHAAAPAGAGLIAQHAPSSIPNPQILSPWAASPASAIVWADLVDSSLFPATRSEAMAIPAVAKARHVVAPKIASYPLREFRYVKETGTDEQVPDPIWATRTNGELSWWHRMVWTVDDLIFAGWSLWRGQLAGDGFPLSFDRVNIAEWSFSDDGRILIGEKPVTDTDRLRYVLIPGPHEGILNFATTAIRHARQLLAAAARAGQTPSAQTELRQTQPVDLTRDEITVLIDDYAAARRGDNAGVSFTSYGIEAHDHGAIDAQLLVEGRNAAAVEMARVVGVAAGMVDATTPKASLNYETQQGRGLEHTEYGVEPYADAIAARLSMDDVVPNGHRVRFDIAQDIEQPVSPTGPTVED